MFKFKRLLVGALAGLVTTSLLVTINLLSAASAQDSAPGRIEPRSLNAALQSTPVSESSYPSGIPAGRVAAPRR